MRRRQRLLTLAMAAGLALMAARAQAQDPPLNVADQPAATLLLPYFEVDLANPAGANTFLTVNNANGQWTVAHVTVWSAMHVPVYGFDIYLTGYDAQTLNVRDILNGVLPRTATVADDPTDTISNQGPFSTDVTVASCSGGVLPPAAVPQATIDHIKAALTGQPSAIAGGMCASRSDGTPIARGYITVDATRDCTLLTPRDPGYFVAGGNGVATNNNVLFGDYLYTNHISGLDSSDGSPLVHITASAVDPKTSTPGEYTFYGRLVSWTAADNREPLATQFFARFGAGISGPSSVVVWRDAKINQTYFACGGSQPTWYPLNQSFIMVFDEQEKIEASIESPFWPQLQTSATFPVGAQRVAVGGSALPTAFTRGFLFLDLNTVVLGSGGPPINPFAAQAWVTVHQKGSGRYSTGWPAIMLDSARNAGTFSIF